MRISAVVDVEDSAGGGVGAGEGKKGGGEEAVTRSVSVSKGETVRRGEVSVTTKSRVEEMGLSNSGQDQPGQEWT